MSNIWSFPIEHPMERPFARLWPATLATDRPPGWVAPDAPVMRAVKQVDDADAHFIEAGSLKIGRLEDYATIENGRADEEDGWLAVMSETLDSENPADRPLLDKLPMPGRARHTRVENSLFILPPSPTYAFCMAAEGCVHDPSPEKPKANFLVENVPGLALLLAEKFERRFHQCLVGDVSYRPRIVTARERGDDTSDPFAKDTRFAVEQEIRIAFTARAGAPFETIYTPPDPEIGQFFRRIP